MFDTYGFILIVVVLAVIGITLFFIYRKTDTVLAISSDLEKNITNKINSEINLFLSKTKESMNQFQKINLLNNQPITKMTNHFTETDSNDGKNNIKYLSDSRNPPKPNNINKQDSFYMSDKTNDTHILLYQSEQNKPVVPTKSTVPVKLDKPAELPMQETKSRNHDKFLEKEPNKAPITIKMDKPSELLNKPPITIKIDNPVELPMQETKSRSHGKPLEKEPSKPIITIKTDKQVELSNKPKITIKTDNPVELPTQETKSRSHGKFPEKELNKPPITIKTDKSVELPTNLPITIKMDKTVELPTTPPITIKTDKSVELPTNPLITIKTDKPNLVKLANSIGLANIKNNSEKSNGSKKSNKSNNSDNKIIIKNPSSDSNIIDQEIPVEKIESDSEPSSENNNNNIDAEVDIVGLLEFCENDEDSNTKSNNKSTKSNNKSTKSEITISSNTNMIKEIDPESITIENLLPSKRYYFDALKKMAKAYSIKTTGSNGKLLRKEEIYNKIKEYLKKKSE